MESHMKDIQEYDEQEKLTCPYCDFEFQDWWEEWASPQEAGDETEIECEICKNTFIATFHYIPIFDAREK